jgi:glycosyltransferase involved in cell wall biosynthesis
MLFPLLSPRWFDAPLEPVVRVNEPMRVAVLGMPRREKGFHWLPSVAAELRPELASGRICLVVQTGSEQIRRERLDAASASLTESPGVRFIESTLDPEQYLRELQRADVVFTPYTRSGYARRLSWIPIEGMALGKPVLVTDHILAADVLRKYRCGLFFDEGDIRSMASAIRRLLGSYSSFHREALRAAVSFRRDNSPDGFFGEMEELFR